jgi:hypothetical protein
MQNACILDSDWYTNTGFSALCCTKGKRSPLRLYGTVSYFQFYQVYSTRSRVLEQVVRAKFVFMEFENASSTTFWGNSRFGDSSAPWQISWRQNRGFIAIASKSFKAGDLICAEYPTTWTKAWHPFSQEDRDRIEGEIQLLNEGNTFSYLYLCHIPANLL